MRRILPSMWFLILLASYATISSPPTLPLTESTGRSTQLNEETEATVGSVLFSEWDYKSLPFAIFSDGSTASRTRIAEDGTESYCFTEGKLYHPYRDYYENLVMCYFSNDGKFLNKNQGAGDNKPKQLNPPIPFTRSETIIT